MESIPTQAMFCEKCGTRIPDGQTQCPACQVRTAAPVQQNNYYAQPGNSQPNGYQGGYQPNGYQPSGYQPNGYQPNGYQPNGYQPNGYQPNGYQPNQPQRRPRKKKKKTDRAGLLLVGGIAAALIVVILIAVFSGVFASNETRLAKMEKTNAKLISEALSSSYGDYLQTMEDSLKKQEKGTGMEAQIQLNANEFFLEALMTPVMGTETDMGWLKNVVLNVDVDAKGEQMAMSCGVGVNDKVLATVAASIIGESNMLLVGVPELNEQYLGFDLQGLDVDMDTVNALQAPTKKLIENMPSEKEVKKMLDKYLNVIFDYVEEVEKVKEEVTVGDETKELTVLKVKITAPKLAQMMIQLLELAQEDEILKDMLLTIGEYTVDCEVAVEGMSYSLKEELYEDLMYELENTRQNLEENVAYIGEDNYILLSNYTASGAIVGRKMEVYTDGMKEMDAGHYIFLPVGNGGVFEAVMEDVKISGTVKGKKVEVNFAVQNRNMLTVAAEDVTFKDSVLNGTFRVMPSRELAYMADLNSSVVDALKIGSQDTYLQIELDGTAAKGSAAISVVVGGAESIGMQVQVKETKYNKIKTPENAVAAQDEYALMRWASGIQFDKLTAGMTEAGVPNEYIEVVNQLAMMMQMSGMLS